jgi:hypothetical protein
LQNRPYRMKLLTMPINSCNIYIQFSIRSF